MYKIDRTVVRNQPYQKSGIGIRERHNERKNESYSNPDIEPQRSHLNIHFRSCTGTYTQALDRMIAEGTVSTRGLKADAKVFGELVFDVNTAYFDYHGGYEYAKEFFEYAYHFAEEEVGSQYILSAVMHADEKNRALSDKLGRDVYHYHLHVIYTPVVEKEVRWTKKCKDKALVGKVKEVIPQISHSKKWAFAPLLDEHGKPVLSASGKPKRIPSYSLLQDRFFEHMWDVGYEGLERGVRGSTDEHLSVLDYKIKQDSTQLTSLSAEIANVKSVKAEFEEITLIGKKKRFGDKVEMSTEEYEKLQTLAKEGVSSQKTIGSLNSEIFGLKQRIWALQKELDSLYDKTKDFFKAVKLAPQKVRAFFDDLFQQAKEERLEKTRHRSNRTGGRDVR